MGNSPSVEAGWPTMVSFVGSVGQIVNIEIVFEPGLTATRFCLLVSGWRGSAIGKTYVAGYFDRSLAEERIGCCWCTC